MGFVQENIVIVAGINELNHLFVLYYHTVLVYTKITIHRSEGDWWWIFTKPLH